ncbi:MAG: EmrB/QacA family drug resistance transporter, partial [Microbacteriaceae bacterium]|nr:EmrB/QacA family drug resistance transporter [Microbacteriaceae bacterium]
LNLSRNIGGSIGISIVTAQLTRNLQVSHADIGAHITDQNAPSMISPMMEQFGLPAQSVLAIIDAEINRQAAFIAYLDDFYVMMWVTFAAIPLVLLLKPQKPGGSRDEDEMPVHMD